MMPVLSKPFEKAVEKAFGRLLAVIGPPWTQAKRGRPPKYRPEDYAWALFARGFYGWSYRTTSAVLKIPRSCLNWAFQKLKTGWIENLIFITAERLRKQFNPDCAIADSTGVSLRAFGFKRAGENRPYLKLHALEEYSRKAHAIWFALAKVTAGHVHDVKIGYSFLTADMPPTLLLADKGYDAHRFYRLAYKHRWRVCMRQRKTCEWNRGLRGRVLKEYDDETYKKFRGRVESPFGAFAKRYHSTIEEQKRGTRERACLLWAAAHNVRTLARLFISLIYWTLSS